MVMKWTSKAAKPHVERIQHALLSGDWGNIFAPGFEPKEFDYKAMRESDDDWSTHFSSKQFRENVSNMIKRLAEEHGRADAEGADLGGGAGLDDVEDIGIELAGLKLDNPRHISFPCNIAHHGNVLNSDAYVTLTLILFPFMAFYANITGRKIRVEQVLDPILFDAKEFIVSNPEYNTLEAGAFVQSFSKSGRDFIEKEQDRAYPDRIRVFDEWEVDFDPEQNFQPWGSVRAWKEFQSRSGLRVLTLNVVQKRDNHHDNNAAQYYSQPPQQPFWSPPPPQQQQQQSQQPFGGFQQQQQQPNFGGHGGSSTPQHSNMSGFHQHQQYQSPPMQQQQQQQQQPVYQSPPMQQQAPPAHQSPPVQSPPMQQQQPMYTSPPMQSPPKQHPMQQQPPPVQYHVRTRQDRRTLPVGTKQAPFVDPNLPTPGVPPAAGYPKNMSMSSSFTEETVETVYEEPEAPKKVPAKQAGFFQRVGSIMTGHSDSDNSQVSGHMKPSPRKYYGQAHKGGYPVTPDTEAETDSSSATL